MLEKMTTETLSSDIETTDEERNGKKVRGIFDAINRTHDANILNDYLSEEMVFRNPSTKETDKAGMIGFHTMLFSAFPDFTYQLERVITKNNTVFVETTLTGTQSREFLGFPPSEKEINVPAAVVIDFQDGRVKNWSLYFDIRTMMRQLGFARQDV